MCLRILLELMHLVTRCNWFELSVITVTYYGMFSNRLELRWYIRCVPIDSIENSSVSAELQSGCFNERRKYCLSFHHTIINDKCM